MGGYWSGTAIGSHPKPSGSSTERRPDFGHNIFRETGCGTDNHVENRWALGRWMQSLKKGWLECQEDYARL